MCQNNLLMLLLLHRLLCSLSLFFFFKIEKIFLVSLFLIVNSICVFTPVSFLSPCFFHPKEPVHSLLNSLLLCLPSVPRQSLIPLKGLSSWTKSAWRCLAIGMHRAVHLALETKPTFLCDFYFFLLTCFEYLT